MPSRFVSLAILIYWSIAAFCLLSWDVLPELSMGYAPDLRSIALAGDSNEPVRWSIQVIDDPKTPDIRRTIGAAVTGSSRRPDGWFELTSQVEFEAGGLLKGRRSGPLRIFGWRSTACIASTPPATCNRSTWKSNRRTRPGLWSRSRASSRERRWKSFPAVRYRF